MDMHNKAQYMDILQTIFVDNEQISIYQMPMYVYAQ